MSVLYNGSGDIQPDSHKLNELFVQLIYIAWYCMVIQLYEPKFPHFYFQGEGIVSESRLAILL